MLLSLLIWAAIFFVLFSFGDFFLSVYHKICNTAESYNITETFLLGLCSILMPLQLLSLFLPINQYTLLAFLVLSLSYWVFNSNKAKTYCAGARGLWKSISLAGKIVIPTSLVLIFMSCLTYYAFYDAEYYHYQNIKWNETFAVIPGLGNLEDRFGFNSNYLLISSLFSFSFVKGEVYTMLQIVLFALIWLEFTLKLFRGKWNIQYLIILFLLSTMYFVSFNWFRCSSTDIIPILVVSYLLIKIVDEPKSILRKPLLFIVTLVTLLTFKISIGLLCLICLLPLYMLVKEKNYKNLFFICGSASIILVLWLIRNVILIGYLIFPLYQIDLFSFDWKMASGVLKMEQAHIKAWAIHMFKLPFVEVYYSSYIRLNILLGALSLICPIVLFIKRKTISQELLIVSIVTYVSMVIGILNAPDVRFVNGFIFGLLIIMGIILAGDLKLRFGKIMKSTFCVIILFMYIYPFSYFFEYYIPIDSSILLTPQACNQVAEVEGEHKLESVTLQILRPSDEDVRPFYSLFVFLGEGVPYTSYGGHKTQSLKTVEARGPSIEDGFRTKEEYINTINSNVNDYLVEYYRERYNITKEIK